MSIKRPDLLTQADAAAYLGMSKSWLAQTKDGPIVTRIGSRRMYLQADLDEYITSRRSSPPATQKETAACLSTPAKAPRSYGTVSRSTAKSTAGRLARQTADELRQLNAGNEPRWKPNQEASGETTKD